MKIFAVNRNNDLHLGPSGSLAIATGGAALAQKLEHTMQSLLGEMIHATDRGLPYAECIWGGARNLRQFETFARKALLQEEAVNSVTEFGARVVENTLQYSVTLQTIYGEVVLRGN